MTFSEHTSLFETLDGQGLISRRVITVGRLLTGSRNIRDLGSVGGPARQRGDRVAEGEASVCERVGAGVVAEGQTGEDARRLEFAQAGCEHVRGDSEVALEIAVALRAVEETLHDEQGPPRPDDVESRRQVAHSAGAASGFIQNGE